tara:strand:+ start:302 stop:580 length:279 start_codon:yes stop_codon:yes gene_type:complete
MKENWQNTTFNRKEYVMSQPKIKKLTQKEMILQHLKEGKSITPIDALRKFGCFRLSDRIFVLRKEGNDITTNYITKGGKTFAEYILEENQNA